MTADDLSTPLGQRERKPRRKLPIPPPQIIAASLALFLGAFAVWAVVADDPFGGEPMVAVPIDLRSAMTKKAESGPPPDAAATQNPNRQDGPAKSPTTAMTPVDQAPAGNTKTVTIIDGKTGARQEVTIPGTPNEAGMKDAPPAEQKFAEITAHGPIPKIAADGTRPAEAFAQPVKPIPGKPDAPRIALIVGGLGVSASATAAAIAKLPGAVTLAFMPYGADVGHMAERARGEGHEILLQVPLEPFGYPDNDSGPQTLLTSLTPEQNLVRLYWLMGRFQGYVGIAGAMGARFTASEPAFSPILRETAKRGLIFVDDGANPRSVAGRIAGANNLPFAKADLVLDAVPTPVEVDHALGRLEMAAREHGVAVGISSALPVSIDHIAKWAKVLESHGFLLVPITAIALKPKQS
jgi:polysaccharide deacetylase 2 family uncharacterized protein YibQ